MKRRNFLKALGAGLLGLVTVTRIGRPEKVRTLPRGIHTIPLTWIRVDTSANKRTYNTSALEESIKHGPMCPLIVTEDLILVDGYLRYMALLRLGFKEAPVMVLGIYDWNTFHTIRNVLN